MTGLEIKDFTIIISGTITALSTLAAVIITNRYNYKSASLNVNAEESRNERERKLLKIEDVYFLFVKWESTVTSIYLTHLRCYCNKLDYRSVMELTKKQEMLGPGDYQKLQMLMHVHFPFLAREFAHVTHARSCVSPFLRDPEESKLNAKDFVSVQEAFDEACAIFKQKMSKLAEELSTKIV